ncbi:MAG TPA: sensor domain-containing diguanylate cyclase [Pirellulales bacterium]|jgi:diguanylate cyclase (GGDEF)-like protein
MSTLLSHHTPIGAFVEGEKLDVQAFPNFATATSAALTFLRGRFAFDLWMLTRTRGDHYVILETAGGGYDVQPGDVLYWTDTLCYQMATGRGPRFISHIAESPVYSPVNLARDWGIGAYLGVPLTRCDGSLFGTLCAIHSSPLKDDLTCQLPMIELFARMLSSLLDVELHATRQARLAERAQADALTDVLTGLYNRRGWDQLLTAEESRCGRYAHPACIVSIDLDELKRFNDTGGHAAGDELLRRTGNALQRAVREHDVLARVGGDEFAVLGVEVEGEGEIALAGRIDNALAVARIRASIGLASRDPTHGLLQAWRLADQRMYAQKQRHKPPRLSY